MNSPVPMNKNDERFTRFNQELEVVNDDWPLLGEINQNKFLINKKKPTLNIAKAAKEIIEHANREDQEILTNAVLDEAKFEETFLTPANITEKIVETVPEAVQEVSNKVSAPIVNKVEQVIPVVESTQNLAPLKQVVIQKESLTKVQVKPVVIKKEAEIENNTLIKLIFIGLSKLYLKKTTVVLNPVKFVAENYKNVLIALLHLSMPILMSWFLVTQIGFIKAQMAEQSYMMFWSYSVLFYFASLFTWVSTQVILAGILSMFKTTLVSVAKNVDTNN